MDDVRWQMADINFYHYIVALRPETATYTPQDCFFYILLFKLISLGCDSIGLAVQRYDNFLNFLLL